MNTSTLPEAVSGERFEFSDRRTGRLSAYAAGDGAPLLLVHSINAAASAAEMRPLHEHYRATRRVFSIDLPGYGFADRSDRRYTPRLMTDAIHAVTDEIRRRCGSGPIDALALSLSCEFLARAAVESPEAFRSLALVSPTGFDDRLELPVWVAHGVRGDFTNYRRKSLFARRPNWSFTVFETGALPYFEVGERFIAGYDAFLGRVPERG